jgi:putative oxidoreductase
MHWRDLVWLSPLDRYSAAGPVLLRWFVGFVLVYGTQDNVLHEARMLEFRDFLAQHAFPAPLTSAYLSAYAQLLAGTLIIIGFLTRWAALVMLVNFSVALGMVHAGLPFSANIAPLAMLFGALFLLMHGAGRFSADAYLRNRDEVRSGGARAAGAS